MIQQHVCNRNTIIQHTTFYMKTLLDFNVRLILKCAANSI